MNWELYKHPHARPGNTIGKVASVYISEDRSLIKRYYSTSHKNVAGKYSHRGEEYVIKRFNTEVKHLLLFEDKPWVPELVDINYKERYTIQRYYGPDLLLRGFDDIPDIVEQVLSIYRYFKEINKYKINSALSNMTKKDGQVMLFDFKYMQERHPNIKPLAEREIRTWLWKISPNDPYLTEELLKLI